MPSSIRLRSLAFSVSALLFGPRAKFPTVATRAALPVPSLVPSPLPSPLPSPVAVLVAVFMAVLAVLTLAVAGTAEATVIEQRITFAEPVMTAAGDFHELNLPGAMSYGKPGEPVLPVSGLQVLLPPGEVVTGVEVIPGQAVTLPGTYRLAPGQPQRPLSDTSPVEVVAPNPHVYHSANVFPAALHSELSDGYFRGHRIASLALYPVQYIPARGQVTCYGEMRVRITTAPDAAALAHAEQMIRRDAGTLTRLGRLVSNPAASGAYDAIGPTASGAYDATGPAPAGTRDLDPSLGYTYLIITGDTYAEEVEPLVAFHTERGRKAGLFLKSWILENYTSGVDEQERIRDFIIDAYQTWGADYVLLVGDARDENGIPHRGLYSDTDYGEWDADIPADMYYGCLDGNWNIDGDDRWGEPGEDDLYHEVAVGRACVSDEEDALNFVTKVMRYTTEPVLEEADEALMVAELLWSNPLTWGGDSKDEVKDGSTAHGYTTTGFPSTMNVETLYDRDGTWSKSTLIDLMTSGAQILNHLGHCNVTYMMKMDNADIASFDNDGIEHTYNFVYTQGCYCGSFDNRTTSGGYTADCFSELFQTHDAGAVAVVSNSRYGWGDPGGTDGSSQYFDREYFDAMFGEAIFPVAEANDDSKMDNIWSIDFGGNRWCYYQLNVFGDPAMELWTAVPEPLAMSHPGAILIAEDEVEVSVSSAGSPVAGARVTIYSEDYATYGTALADDYGIALVPIDPQSVGTLYVKATAHDHLEVDGMMQVVPPDGPYLVIDELEVYEPGGDGVIHAGEAVQMRMLLSNVGTEDAHTVSAALSVDDEYVTLTTGTQAFPDIPAGGSAWSDGFYAFDVAPLCPDLHLVQMPVTVEGQARQHPRQIWEDQINLVVHAPEISIESMLVDDTVGGNGNLRLDPGETATIAVTLQNSGSGPLTGIEGLLTCDHSQIAITSTTGSNAGLAEDEMGLLEPVFEVTVDAAYPYLIGEFELRVTGSNDYDLTFECPLPVGGFFETVENGCPDWTHYHVTENFGDQWHIAETRNHTVGGTYSWKAGDETGGNYDHLLDAALETCAVELGGVGELRFWMWIEAEQSNSFPGRAYDGGVVEMSVDGGPFEPITPEGGYTHTIRAGGTPGPFAENTEVYSGTADWRQEIFDLEGVSGSVSFRFRFGTDGAVALEGWYIDDIEILGIVPDFSGAGDEQPLARQLFLSPARPNPMTGPARMTFALPQSETVALEVFDATGRLVRTLIKGELPAGEHIVGWDGFDEDRHPAGSGLYYCRLRSESEMLQRPVVLIR